MSVKYQLTFNCETCELQYSINSNILTMPPHWVSIQVMVSNIDGLVTEHEEVSPLYHFCSIDCLSEFVRSQQFKERVLMVDSFNDDDQSEHE